MNLITMHGIGSSSQSKDIVTSKESRLIYVFGFCIITLIFMILVAYFSNFNDGFGDQAEFGAFGDFIGGTLNPILSFVTIVLLIWSIRLQRKELMETRVQFERSAIAQEQLEINQKRELQFYQRKEVIENLKSEMKSLDSIKHEVLNRQFSFASRHSGYLLSSVLIFGNKLHIDALNYFIESFDYKNATSEYLPLQGIITDLIFYTSEYNYNLKRLYDLEEYDLYVIRLYSFISFVEKLSLFSLGTKQQLNGLALYAYTIVTGLPDLKDDHINGLKTYILERVIKINLLTEKIRY